MLHPDLTEQSTVTPLKKTIQAAAFSLTHTSVWRRSSVSVGALDSKRPFLMSRLCCSWMCLFKEVYLLWIKKEHKFKYRTSRTLQRVQGCSVIYEGAGWGNVNSPPDTGAHIVVQLFKGIHLIYIFWGLWFKRSTKLWGHNHKNNLLWSSLKGRVSDISIVKWNPNLYPHLDWSYFCTGREVILT